MSVLKVPTFEARINRILANQTLDEHRHAKWLEKRERDALRARQRIRQVPSARDLDLVAKEEAVREATKAARVVWSLKGF